MQMSYHGGRANPFKALLSPSHGPRLFPRFLEHLGPEIRHSLQVVWISQAIVQPDPEESPLRVGFGTLFLLPVQTMDQLIWMLRGSKQGDRPVDRPMNRRDMVWGTRF